MSKSTRRATSIPGMKGWSCIEDAKANVDAENISLAPYGSLTGNCILLYSLPEDSSPPE